MVLRKRDFLWILFRAAVSAVRSFGVWYRKNAVRASRRVRRELADYHRAYRRGA